MIKVLRYGNTIAVRNPQTGQETTLVNVIFIEEGRSGGDNKMSETSQFLSQLVGDEVGLSNLRTHTHPVLADKVGLFPEGKEFPGMHINRGLFSTPQMKQQEVADPRMIDGRPTYFKTWIDNKAEDDVDHRISNDVLLVANPSSILNARVGGTEVRILETANTNNEKFQTVRGQG